MKQCVNLFLMALVLFTIGCEQKETVGTTPITVSGIDFKPNFFQLDGKIVGIDADIAAQALKNAGISADFNMASSWEEAYQSILTGSNKALLSVAYTKERKDLFKWAGPTCKRGYEIFAKASSGVAGSIGVEASKSIESIAVVRNWDKTTLLEEMGFTNLSYYNSYEEAINAFKNDEVKAIASDQVLFLEAVTFDYYMQQKISVTCIFEDAFFYIAFSKDVDDQIVKRCQDAIDALIVNGSTFDIYREYVPYAVKEMVPSIIQLATEIDPPFNYLSEVIGAQTFPVGSAVDMVNEMQVQSSYKNPISITSWVSAYELIQFMPNYALFTMARTPERENLFQWVGPISTTTACFYTRTASGIEIKTLDDAKALATIATPKGWFSHDFLIENGFQNIVTTAYTSEEAFNQLMSGEADALLLYEIGAKWLCDKTGTPQADLSKQLQVAQYNDYIAFSLSTSPTIVAQWQSNLDAMKADGRFETIWKKWFGDIPMP